MKQDSRRCFSQSLLERNGGVDIFSAATPNVDISLYVQFTPQQDNKTNQHTVVVLLHQDAPQPVDAGSHAAWTRTAGGEPGGALWCIERLFRCGLETRRARRPNVCVTPPSGRRPALWCDAHNDSTRQRVVSVWTEQRSLTTSNGVNWRRRKHWILQNTGPLNCSYRCLI